jgi:hypothetical protein
MLVDLSVQQFADACCWDGSTMMTLPRRAQNLVVSSQLHFGVGQTSIRLEICPADNHTSW